MDTPLTTKVTRNSSTPIISSIITITTIIIITTTTIIIITITDLHFKITITSNQSLIYWAISYKSNYSRCKKTKVNLINLSFPPKSGPSPTTPTKTLKAIEKIQTISSKF